MLLDSLRDFGGLMKFPDSLPLLSASHKYGGWLISLMHLRMYARPFRGTWGKITPNFTPNSAWLRATYPIF